ncbi:MAG: TolC family protein [Thermoanaerobaculia bacterium]
MNRKAGTAAALAFCSLGPGLLAQPAGTAPAKLTLADAVRRALSDGTAAKLAALRVEESRANALDVKSGLFPKLEGSVQDLNEVLNLKTFGLTIPGFPSVVGPFNVFDAHLAAAYNVIDLGARRRYQAARTGLAVSQTERRRSDDDVAAAVVTVYLSVRKAEAQVDETRANVSLFERLSELAQHQLDSGVATKLDTTRARVQLSRRRQDLLVAQTERDIAGLVLRRAIGAGLGDRFVLEEPAIPDRAVPPLEEVLEQAAGRPELEAAKQRLEQARLEFQAIRAEKYPKLVAQAQGGYNGNYLGDLSWNRVVGATVSVPIFTGGQIGAREAQASARARELEVQALDARRQVEEDVRRALLAYESAANRVTLSEETATLAADELDLSRDRFANGISSDVEVDNAQTALTSARDSRLAALSDRAQAWFDLQHATGRIRQVILQGGK